MFEEARYANIPRMNPKMFLWEETPLNAEKKKFILQIPPTGSVGKFCEAHSMHPVHNRKIRTIRPIYLSPCALHLRPNLVFLATKLHNFVSGHLQCLVGLLPRFEPATIAGITRPGGSQGLCGLAGASLALAANLELDRDFCVDCLDSGVELDQCEVHEWWRSGFTQLVGGEEWSIFGYADAQDGVGAGFYLHFITS